MAGNNAKKIGSEIEIFDKLESWNWLGIVWGYEINSKIYEDNRRGRKKTKSTGHHIAHSTSKLHCANTKKLRLLHKFYERAKGGVFHFQNCMEIVCSRWRLPSERIEKVFGKLKRKLKIITLKQIINYQNQNSEKKLVEWSSEKPRINWDWAEHLSVRVCFVLDSSGSQNSRNRFRTIFGVFRLNRAAKMKWRRSLPSA